jgi:chromosome segregation ATPase
VFVVLAAALGYLVGNEVQANTQFDRAHRSLDITRARIDGVDGQLATVRSQLTDLQGQVTQDSATLAADTTKLNGAKVALANSQANNSRQSTVISNLHTCLGGVEEALNALSVGDQSHAVAALDAVAASCESAVASDA